MGDVQRQLRAARSTRATSSGSAAIRHADRRQLLGSPHRFRIDWTATSVAYAIDCTVVATHAVAIAANMRPLVSDFSTGGGAVAIDWLRLTPYAATATFTSRVIDAGDTVTWGALSWTAALPPGTSVVMTVRTGNSPAPDASWTPFAPVAQPGGAIGGSSRCARNTRRSCRRRIPP